MLANIFNRYAVLIQDNFSFEMPNGEYRAQHYRLLVGLVLLALYLRIINLGVPDLSGDEDIMALAVRGLHDTGQPVLPSGMEYRRAIIHTYLLHASTVLFGQSEWALRFPSVLTGMLFLFFMFHVGKRFLSPSQNIASFALFSLAPPLIEISRTARMYGFMVLFVAIFIFFALKWEKEAGHKTLFAAVLSIAIAITFNPLAIFALPIIFWPAFSSGSLGKFCAAVASCISILVFHLIYGDWVGAPYPRFDERPLYIVAAESPALLGENGDVVLLAKCLLLVSAIAFVLFSKISLTHFKGIRASALIVGVALVAFKYYLPGGYLILTAGLWRRSWNQIFDAKFVLLSTMALFIFTIDLVSHAVQFGDIRDVLRTTLQKSSPFLWIRSFELQPVPIMALLFLSPLMIIKKNSGCKSPGWILLIIFALLAPMFMMSTFRWDFEYRYLLVFIPLAFVLTIALVQSLISECVGVNSKKILLSGTMLAATVTILSMQPMQLLKFLIGDYSGMPGHRAAAEFVAGRDDFNDAIIIAEDSILAYYYLGRLDYRLQYGPKAASYSRILNGRIVDQYTGVPIIGSGPELRNLLCASRSPVYVIGDGQVHRLLRDKNRGGGIAAILTGSMLTPILETDPDLVTVWEYVGSCETDAKLPE